MEWQVCHEVTVIPSIQTLYPVTVGGKGIKKSNMFCFPLLWGKWSWSAPVGTDTSLHVLRTSDSCREEEILVMAGAFLLQCRCCKIERDRHTNACVSSFQYEAVHKTQYWSATTCFKKFSIITIPLSMLWGSLCTKCSECSSETVLIQKNPWNIIKNVFSANTKIQKHHYITRSTISVHSKCSNCYFCEHYGDEYSFQKKK